MTVQTFTLLLFSIVYSLTSCTDKPKDQTPQQETKITKKTPINIIVSHDSLLSNDYIFYGDSIFPKHRNLIKQIVDKYKNDTCALMSYSKKDLTENFSGYKALGDVNGDGKSDSVFVLPPMNWCDSGEQTFYFTDIALPRLNSGSSCAHADNVFKTVDIDEDGFCEIGFYYSSCASRYKSLLLYKYKNNQWQEIATADFDVLTQDPDKVKLEDLVQKISKNEFRIKNFIDGKKYWDTVLLK